MVELNLIDGVRVILIVSTIYVLVALGWRYIRVYRHISVSQKLLVGSLLAYASASGARSIEAILADDGFKFTLFLFALGVVLNLVYLSKPYNKVRNRQEEDLFTPDLNGDEIRELRRLRVENDQLQDRNYELARRNNILRLQAYRQEDSHGS